LITMQRALFSFRRIPLKKSFSLSHRVNVTPFMGVRFMSDQSRHQSPKGDGGGVGTAQYKKLLQDKIKSSAKPKTNTDYRKAPPPPRALYFSGTLGKYSHELFNTAVKTNDFQKFSTQLNDLLNTFNSDTKLQTSLISPIVRKDEKVKIVKNFVGSVSAPVAALVERLVLENRIRDFKILVDYFSRLVAEKLGQVSATVFSVEPLTQSQLQRIENRMVNVLEPGKTLVLSTQLNPKLLGGIKIRIGDRELDLSVSSKLKQFEQVFRSAMN